MGLRNVPDDELDELRALFAEAGIEIRETPAGPLGITAGSLWVVRDEQMTDAKRRFDHYQNERGRRARAEREAELREGRAIGFMQVLKAEPLRVIAVIAGILFLLGLSVLPFLLLRA
jgi:hypothetical protein